MTTYYWLGVAGTDASVPDNWGTTSGDMSTNGHGVNPGASGNDKVVFDGALTVGLHSFGDSVIDVTNDQVVISSHGYSTNDQLWIMSDGADADYPSTFTERQLLYAIAVDANTLKFAATSGGSALALDGMTGSFKTRRYLPATFAAGQTFTEVEVKSTMAGEVTFPGSGTVTIKNGLTNEGTIIGGAANAVVDFTLLAASGYGTTMVKNGYWAKITNPQHLTFNYKGTQNPITFDDGPHPNVVLIGATGTAVNFRPQYGTPTSTTFKDYDDGKTTFYSFTATGRTSNAITFQPAATTTETDDGAKKFKITSDGGFACTVPLFDAGYSEWDFQASNSGFALPATGSASYSPTNGYLTSKIRKMKAHASTAGHKVTLGEGDILTCESLEIEDGCVLKGPAYASTYSAEIQSVKAPVIKGSWNFAQVAPGVYRSPLALLPNQNETPHIAHISLSSSVTGFASGAYTIAPLDTADVDTASAWDNTNKCWVVPRDGKYLVAYSIGIRYITSSHLAIANLYKQSGGSGTFSGSTVSRATYGRDSGEPSGGTILLNCAANDRIALYAYHNGGSGKNLQGDAVTEGLTFLSIMEVL
jgi:hypothetical protein